MPQFQSVAASVVWCAIVAGSVIFGAQTWIIVGIAILDIVLVLVVFKGDIKLR